MNILYQITIAPIQAVMNVALSAIFAVTDSYGISIFLLSLLINVALLPLFQLAERWQESERKVQKILKPKLQEFRLAFSGEERHAMIHTLYRQVGYHPIYAMRSSVGLFLQLPFWIAAYQLLSQYQPLEGASFLFFEDLGKPDSLLWGFNLLPFVMATLNLAAAYVYTKSLSRTEQIQPLVLASLFLGLLYSSPAGLLLYWTFNSLFSLLRIALTRTTDVGQQEPLASLSQRQLTSKSDLAQPLSQTRREFLPLYQGILGSPYALAFFAGLWPIIFHMSNNWFMFDTSRIVLVVIAVTAIVWAILSLIYFALSRLSSKVCAGRVSTVTSQVFAFISILGMGILLRRTFLAMTNNNDIAVALGFLVVASTVALLIPKIQIFRLNAFLGVMCLLHLLMGMQSMMAANIRPMIQFDIMNDFGHPPLNDRVSLLKKPNVYYIVPDGYPNGEGLSAIFNLDGTEFHGQLNSLGFRLYPTAYSNYSDTLSSISSVFGMAHHYYRGSIGNFELVGARQFIVSLQNPVTRIFKNNGYQIHFIHDDGWLFTSGCFVDSCSPMHPWGEVAEILAPPTLRSIFPPYKDTEHIAQVEALENEAEWRSDVLQRVFAHVDSAVKGRTPHFTYIHLRLPGHSFPGPQTPEELTSFRNSHASRVKLANKDVLNITHRILDKDPNALIAVGADHGGWGYGSYTYAKNGLTDGSPSTVMALDHLGILLAIRWPNDLPLCDQTIQTNVSLFRHIFACLSGNNEFLEGKIPDDGFLFRWERKKQIVVKAVSDGAILTHVTSVLP